MSNDTGISGSRNGSKWPKSGIYATFAHHSGWGYVLFQSDLIIYIYEVPISRKNSDEVEFMARNTAVLLIFAAHIGET